MKALREFDWKIKFSLHLQEKKCQRAAVEIMRLEIELLDARERANYAEQKLTRLGIKF